MAQKMISPPRRLRLQQKNIRRSWLGRKWLIILIVVTLLAILTIALLFLQANKAASDLNNANQANRELLQRSIDETTKIINTADIQQENDRNKAFKALTDLSANADGISETCASASDPYIDGFAKNYQSIASECEDITSTARGVRDSVNGFIPIAQYNAELVGALKPLADYHRGDDKLDISKGLAAWDDTRNRLQGIDAPEILRANHAAMIDASAAARDALTKAQEAKDNDIAQYGARLDDLNQHYAKMNSAGETIRSELAKAQNLLNESAKNLKD